ncbi:thiamine ABC transporter substrate binding subunit [Alphaproteobacteria bacterium]|nr:thiamine ABC transporter substrate binding subunit [Alphaproteobacteria bacterium]
MRIVVLLTAFFLSTSLVAKEKLNILTYDSFTSEWGPGPLIKKEFESTCNCEVIWTTADSSGALLSRIKLTNNKEGFDIILGIDNALMDEAKKTKLFSNHTLSKLSLDSLIVDWNDEVFVPFDYGYFSFVYNASNIKNPPKSFEELANRNEIKIIITDPRTSTPGLGLAQWIYQLKGSDSEVFWNKLQDQITFTSKSWSDAYALFLEKEADMVLSYTSSPAYHMMVENDDNYKALLFDEGHAMQIEVMGMLKNAPNKSLAESFMKFAITKEFQKYIPGGNWMYPVTSMLPKPDKDIIYIYAGYNMINFYEYAPVPKPLDIVYGSTDDKEKWIEYWLSSIE